MNSIDLSDEDFSLFKKMTYDLLGIHLNSTKKHLVLYRLSSRIRDLGLTSFHQYFQYLKSAANSDLERRIFIEKIVTNETYFFRESEHFPLLLALVNRLFETQNHVRIWSAPCSSGEEPYTISMVMQDKFVGLKGKSFQILGTDVSDKVLSVAIEGIYPKEAILEKTPKKYLRFFAPVSKTEWVVNDEIKSKVAFRNTNLIRDRYPLKSPVDIIFCRNLLIYFDEQTKKKLLTNFHAHLSKNGLLFLGHSESIYRMNEYYSHLGSTVYQKIG